ncbi:MAG TPA: GTPase [Phycisphaerae bacterium]|nr:GTPase [Phycisphaerae bacterium]
MPLNLTPDYLEADRKYRQARTREEKLAALEQMLRVIPKHKGSEKKQADLKSKISELRHATPTGKSKSATVDPYHVPSQGGGQALLFGLPNSGKSSILGRLSKAPVKITDFPFGTQLPVPGMVYHEDVPIQMVDLPPVMPEHVPPGMVNALRSTEVILLVVDLSAGSVLEDTESLLAILEQRNITFEAAEQDDTGQIMQVWPRGLIVGTKIDVPGASDNLEVLRELRPAEPPIFPVSGRTGEGLPELTKRLFEMLHVIRVYSKLPGKPPDKEKPFVLPAGSTVGELARQIHKDIADHLKYARLWGPGIFDGQQVHAAHPLADRYIVELHA